MSSLPFTIRKFRLTFENTVEITEIDDTDKVDVAIPGYFVMSSAPPNIEEAEEASPAVQQQAIAGVQDIAHQLYHKLTNAPHQNADLVIVVHGYNTSRTSVETWYKGIFKTINLYNPGIKNQTNSVFVGYRWPSERAAIGNLREAWSALCALPPLPRDLLIAGAVSTVMLLLFELLMVSRSFWQGLVSLGLILLAVLGMLVLSLVILRLVVYFRDRYRADNFGVLDLVELLRQIDQAFLAISAQHLFPDLASPEHHEQAMHQAREYWQKRPNNNIKLSFIGHSMGGFVVTNVVRLLADVFDIAAISKQPSPNVGSIFRLERLVLASPDIPVLSIISSRANFLASSLRRFSESYLFCNEGDIALRIASTAANYIAFPSRTQSRGYRLGNVALQNRRLDAFDYGIVNLKSLDIDFPTHLPIGMAIEASDEKVLENLFLTYKRFQKRGAITLADLFEAQTNTGRHQATVADFFTFFDCTDYIDFEYDPQTNGRSAKPQGLLTRARGKKALTPWDYLLLTLDYGLGKRDVHGGYFRGEFSQSLLYQLAFLGFENYLNSLDDDPQTALSRLHDYCQQKQIQGFLSPFRYRVTIQGASLEGSKQELLSAIQKSVEI